jgi:quercetin dioxygenase-like cupin family protein
MNITQQAQAKAGTFGIDLQVEHVFSTGVYAKRMVIPQGYEAFSHAHAYDHISILAQGVALVTTDDTEQVYEQGSCITIKAGVHHRIQALEDVVWFCIHAAAEGEIDVVLVGKENQS